MLSKSSWRAALAGLMVLGAAQAANAVPPEPAAIDLGAAASTAEGSHVSFTVVLKLRNAGAAEAMLQSLYTPGNPQFRKFLSSAEFKTRFAPSAETVARVAQHFRAAGFAVKQTTATHLVVTGSATQVEAEFGVPMHEYELTATADRPTVWFHAPLGAPQLSTAIVDAVRAVVGLDSRPRYRSHLVRAAQGPLSNVQFMTAPQSSGTTNAPGYLTVSDFAQYYDVKPLYQSGLTGSGTTIGIVTLASFTPSDAYAYWNQIGLSVAPNRITEIPVDGGAGGQYASGYQETTLDVEQAGGLAPYANIDVYEAPNSDQGFVDAFAAAIDANQADTLSVSWGAWEVLYSPPNDGSVVDPVTGGNTSVPQALNDLFLQAALQGQSVFAAAGDSGAYDAARWFPPPSYPPPAGSVVLSVDAPASLRWITAVGGTTLPLQFQYTSNGQTQTMTVPTERAWGWDYWVPVCSAYGYDPLSCPSPWGSGIYPIGGGGGVSSLVPRPIYQQGIAGIQNTASGQTLLDYTATPPALFATLPAGYQGRNVPDISLNSDPYTGYITVISYLVNGTSTLSTETGWGGTSFAAPQFNGVTALFDQALHGRVGLLNFVLYRLARGGSGYQGSKAPLRDITAGDNWGYSAHAGYDQASGLGVPDFANLLNALEREVEN